MIETRHSLGRKRKYFNKKNNNFYKKNLPFPQRKKPKDSSRRSSYRKKELANGAKILNQRPFVMSNISKVPILSKKTSMNKQKHYSTSDFKNIVENSHKAIKNHKHKHKQLTENRNRNDETKKQFKMPVTRVSTETLAKLPYNRDIQVTIQIIQAGPDDNNIPTPPPPLLTEKPLLPIPPIRKWFLSNSKKLNSNREFKVPIHTRRTGPRKRDYEYDYLYYEDQDYGKLICIYYNYS